MTGRERLLCILNREPTDRAAWTTLIDGPTRTIMSEDVQATSHMEFYRLVGCDVLLLGTWALAEDEQAVAARPVSPNVEDAWDALPGSVARHERRSPWGILTSEYQNGHPTRYPVQTLDDVRILTAIWEDTSYVPTGADYASALRAIGDSGILADALAASPVQQLIEMDMGLSGFYYLLDDHRSEVEHLMAVMHDRRLREYEIVAERTGADVVIPMENTSTMLTSPEIYRRYSLPQIRDYVRVVHSHGRKCVVHMCGHIRNLLTLIRETEMDGVNGLTPPPVGDTWPEDALDVCGEDFIILGGVFPPNVMHQTQLSYAQLSEALTAIYTARVRNANYLLWMGVDGLPTDIERFRMMRRWFDENGRMD